MSDFLYVFTAWHRRRWTSSSSGVGVSKASAFRFVSRAVCSPYSTLNLRRPSFSSRRAAVRIWNSLPQHVTSVPSLPVFCTRLKTYMYFFELLFIILFVVPAKWHRHFGHVNRFYLLTYLLTSVKIHKNTRSESGWLPNFIGNFLISKYMIIW